ncbi:hypothetical protein [Algibacter lectus]|nr:hypothetical protein [Algibacter lectus]MDO7135934.1 hypothetical protein [Algibacter lectus]
MRLSYGYGARGEAVEQMNDDDKSVVSKLIDAFITKRKIQAIL